MSMTSDAVDLWSESEEPRIDPIMYSEFVTPDRLHQEQTVLADKLRLKIMEDSRAHMLPEVEQMIDARISES